MKKISFSKKVIGFIIFVFLIGTVFLGYAVHSCTVRTVSTVPVETTSSTTVTTETTTSVTSKHFNEPYCKAAALYCIDDEKYIYSDRIKRPIKPASLTKLLTASVVLNSMETDELITVGTELSFVKPDSSRCWINTGNTAPMIDLLSGLLMSSGNDAAYTLAVASARKMTGDEEMSDEEAVSFFCNKMNELASEIGMNDSHFANPEGWDDDEQYTTVSDLILLSRYAMTFPEIREIVSTSKMNVTFTTGEEYIWRNSNMFVSPESGYYRENVVGIKTGSTKKAGNCLITQFDKNGKTYISVVAGCKENTDRYKLTLKLMRLIRE